MRKKDHGIGFIICLFVLELNIFNRLLEQAFKTLPVGQAQWFRPIILATWETEIGRVTV
jgi:hypothetical protein